MKVYDSKEWARAVISFHRSDTFRKLLIPLIISALFSWAVAYLELEYFKLSDKSWLKNITVIHTLLGFALSLLLVFRTNTAYDRWWEARKQWGSLTNISRSFAIKINNLLPKEDKSNRNFFRKAIPLYAKTLFSHLRSDYTTYMLDEINHPELNLTTKHAPNQVLNLMYKHVNALYKEGKITDTLFLSLSHELEEFANICGACERIKNTPLPYSYTSFIKKFIVIYVATLPIGLVFSMGYFVIASVPFIFYVLASLELIAESIENPFGTDPDDLPLEKMTDNIDKHVKEIIAV